MSDLSAKHDWCYLCGVEKVRCPGHSDSYSRQPHQTAPREEPSQEQVEAARAFHDAYERLAPSFGYTTRADSRVFDPHSPNGRLMIAVCDEILSSRESALRAERDALWELLGEAEGLLREVHDSLHPECGPPIPCRIRQYFEARIDRALADGGGA